MPGTRDHDLEDISEATEAEVAAFVDRHTGNYTAPFLMRMDPETMKAYNAWLSEWKRGMNTWNEIERQQRRAF